MPVTGSLSHIDISAGYPVRSIAFYHALLSALGYRRWKIDVPGWSGEHPSRATWGKRHADGSRFEIEVRPSRAETRDQRYDRYAPGPHHFAFHAESDAVVDRVFAAVRDTGGEIIDTPANYGGRAGYGDYYYAVFFADPDGVKIEVCHVPAANP